MEPPYSVWADWLSKFHTWPEGIQALWVLGLTVVALSVVGALTRMVVTIARLGAGQERGMRDGWRRRVVEQPSSPDLIRPPQSFLRPPLHHVGGRIKFGHDGEDEDRG